MDDAELLTAEELAERLRVRPGTIRQWHRAGLHEKGEVGKRPRIRPYVDEKSTNQQVQAATQLLEAVFEVAIPKDLEILPTKKVPIWVERSNATIKYSVPAFGVEIEMMKTRDGRSIGIEEPLGPWARGYKQYKSTYSATNAYTAKWDISSVTPPDP